MEQDLITYSRAAFSAYAESIKKLQGDLKAADELRRTRLHKCRSRYERLRGELESRVSQAQRELSAAREDIRRAQARYEQASRRAGSEDPRVQEAARREMSQARQDESEARVSASRAEARLVDARQKLQRLEQMWNTHYPPVLRLQQKAEVSLSGFSRLREKSRRDLDHYAELMEKARHVLNDYTFGSLSQSSGGTFSGSGTSTVSGSSESEDISISLPANLGWCPQNSMTALHLEEDGSKTVTLTIGGQSRTYPCDRRGMANAYGEASRCRDSAMIAITSAMFEIEDLRANLNLTSGQADIPQLGGYHRDVQKHGGDGYESHHIPAQSVQITDANWLPTISITEEDHALTPSYRGKSKRAYNSFVPKSWEPVTYRQSVSNKLRDGSSGYIHALKNEVLELKAVTGNKYDGGISAFLDAVLDMLSTRGIPRAK